MVAEHHVVGLVPEVPSRNEVAPPIHQPREPVARHRLAEFLPRAVECLGVHDGIQDANGVGVFHLRVSL